MLVAPDHEGVWNLHVLSELLTIAAIWAMEWRRWRIEKTPGSVTPELNA